MKERPVSRAVTDADGRYELTGIPCEELIREFFAWLRAESKDRMSIGIITTH